MFCESCGSRIPDGAKFCTECGARVAAQPAREIPDGAESPARSMWSVPAQSAAPYDPAVPQDGAAYSTAAEPSDSGWSIPGGMPASVPIRTDVPEAKPLYTRWWFWLILVVGIGLFALLIFFALIVLSLRNTMPPVDSPEELVQSILEEADVPELEIPELDGLLSGMDDAFPLDADDNYTPMDTLLERIEQSLSDTELEYDVWADEDGWVFVDVWKDGMDELAAAANGGDVAALEEWQAMTESIRAMSGDYLADLLEGGQHGAVCVVSLLDDADTDLSLVIAIDGELIFDLATGLDEYGLLEE